MQLHTQADGMKPRYLVVLLIILSMILSILPCNIIENSKAASVLPKFYVDDDYDSSTPGWQIDHFDVIQDAIDLSSSGDRIIVYEGTYYERLTISHKLDLFGEDKDITIIDGGDTGNVITISAEYVNISHFTIMDSGSSSSDSIIAISQGNCIITDNIVSDGSNGISINNCDSNTIYDNIITDNTRDGISLTYSDSNSITYNTITSNTNGLFLFDSSYNTISYNSEINQNDENGLFLNETSNYNTISYNDIAENSKNGIFLNDHCDYNTLSNDEVYSNVDSGFRLENSSYNTIDNSTASSNTNYGIMIVGSSNTVLENTIEENEEHGIFLFADDYNTIYDNEINDNTDDGIYLVNSTNDTIYTNDISENGRYGINLDYFTFDNLIYDNYIHDNNENAMDKSIGHNDWNKIKTLGSNIVGGSYICGNYWDDFDETSEGAIDDDGDGVSDESYTIYASNKDNGPILDTIAPTIGTPQVSPTSQEIGSDTYISATITDNTEIKNVFLVITFSSSTISNFSILQNNTGYTYFCNKKYLSVGSYSYYITAEDPRNWAISSTGYFYIHEGIPPTIKDNSVTTGSPSNFFVFNATVIDDRDSSKDLTVKVNWHHGSLSGNYTMKNVYSNYFQNAALLDNSDNNLYYYIYATDQWGNSVTTAQKTVKITDSSSPEITIERYGSSDDILPYSYTFGATITDDTSIAEATIEYWYTGSSHINATMDKKSTNYYEKTIIVNSNPDVVYCIIYATDDAGNIMDTKIPFANSSGPYIGIVNIDVAFDASHSFDLDGTITDYLWTFGDGGTGKGATVSHKYLTNGVYSVSLTVTDNDGNKKTDDTYITVIPLIQTKTSDATLDYINNIYTTTLSELFYSYDTDGDAIVDKFVDPNNQLKAIHDGYISISGDIAFLLSIDDKYIPEFIWHSNSDTIIDIKYQKGTVISEEKDELKEQAIINIRVDKADWIFIEIDDDYQDSPIIITTENRTISSDRIFRNNNKIYILDDAETNYTVAYTDIFPNVTTPTFTPKFGQIIDENHTTITIKYNVQVRITYAAFGDIDIKSDILTSDNKEFTYTPPGYLEEDYYTFEIDAKALDGDSFVTSSADYYFIPYESPPVPPEKSFIEKNIIFIMLGGIFGVALILLLIVRRKEISFESFIYVKNKKIIPFIKPVIFGPLSIDVNQEKINKAEFYVNGTLKDVLTQEPFIWKWNEKAFFKQNIETKIYDENGKVMSTGQMKFYVFNSPKMYK